MLFVKFMHAPMYKLLFLLLLPLSVFAQTDFPLNDRSAFKNPSANWSIQSAVTGNANATNLTPIPGKGVLFCQIKGAKYQPTDDLYFNFEHGNIKISLDFMVPKGSNSGIYLQGRYEVQICDSWLKKDPTDSDCGTIYQRWDEARGTGKEGYEGHPPHLNACRAPGLWNHLEIDFRAPTFDASGKKTTNARFNKVVMNGITLHENLELLGVTRGAISNTEAATGPLRIQGDHGEVAFKNLQIETNARPLVTFSPVFYQYYTGKGYPAVDTATKLVRSGTLPQATMKAADVKSNFLLLFNGEMYVPETDIYTFKAYFGGHISMFVVDSDTLVNGWYWVDNPQTRQKKLTTGIHKYTIHYGKDFSWGYKSLGISIQRQGGLKQSITERTSLPDPPPVPFVELEPKDKTVVQRSFMMMDNKKLTHVANIGMTCGLNFAYNLQQGSLVKIWRGKFLNTTQMWHDRGEPQTADALGVSVPMNNKFPLALLADKYADFPDSLTTQDLKYKGYRLEKHIIDDETQQYPNFMYEYQGLRITDVTTPSATSEGMTRQLNWEGNLQPGKQLFALIAEATTIQDMGDNRFLIDGQYYVLTYPTSSNKPFIRENKGIKQLVMAVAGKEIAYQFIF